MWSKPIRRATSSTRSISRSRSGRNVGHRRDQRVAVATIVELDTERRQRVPHFLGVELGPEHVVDAARAHGDALTFDGLRIHVFALGRHAPTGYLFEELHRALGVARDRVGVDATLEARARLTPKLQTFRRLRDPHPLEVGRLEQDLGGGVADLGGGPAHDPGDGLRDALGVADEEVFGRERALHAVERGDLLAVGGEADDDAATAESERSNACKGWLRSRST